MNCRAIDRYFENDTSEKATLPERGTKHGVHTRFLIHVSHYNSAV